MTSAWSPRVPGTKSETPLPTVGQAGWWGQRADRLRVEGHPEPSWGLISPVRSPGSQVGRVLGAGPVDSYSCVWTTRQDGAAQTSPPGQTHGHAAPRGWTRLLWLHRWALGGLNMWAIARSIPLPLPAPRSPPRPARKLGGAEGVSRWEMRTGPRRPRAGWLGAFPDTCHPKGLPWGLLSPGPDPSTKRVTQTDVFPKSQRQAQLTGSLQQPRADQLRGRRAGSGA